MTPDELESFANTWIRNSANDAFTNLRLNTVILNLIRSGVTDTFDNYASFRTAILNNRVAGHDWFMRARVNDTGYIYEYFPDTRSINWTASQFNEKI